MPFGSLNVPLLQRSSGDDDNAEGRERRKKVGWAKWCHPFQCAPDNMDVEDRLNLNWVQKWKQYGRFPWKFIFHALLTAACTAMIFFQTTDQTEYVIAMDATWYHLFFPEEFEYAGDYADNTYYFYDLDEVVDSIGHAVQNYVDFPNSSVVPFKYVPVRANVEGELYVYSYTDCTSVYDADNLNIDVDITTTAYDVTLKNPGPLKNLSGDSLRTFFYCMQSMTLNFAYESVHLQYDHPIAYQQYIQLYYDNSVQGGRISLTMNWSKVRVSDLSYDRLIQLYKAMLDLAIIFFATISQALSWVSIGRSFQIFATARRKLSRKDRTVNNVPQSRIDNITWANLPLRTKLRFFNMWFVITILGNIANITASFLDFFIFQDGEAGLWQRFLLGIGTLLAWVNLVRYLEFDKKYTVLISALQRGFPNALRFLLGALPVFIGFALFGVAYFSETSGRFSSFGTACVTLFGLQNGDDVQGTFSDTAKNMVVSRIYLAVFVFISIYGVANIFIAIMDEAYGVSMRQTEAELQKSKALSASRETDISNDDELWTAILGLSKIKPADSGSGGSGSGGSGGGGSGSGGGSDSSSGNAATVNTGISIGVSNALIDEDTGEDSEEDDNEETVGKFMEQLDARHAEFRKELQLSLATFMTELKTRQKKRTLSRSGTTRTKSPRQHTPKQREDIAQLQSSLSAYASRQRTIPAGEGDSDDIFFNDSPRTDPFPASTNVTTNTNTTTASIAPPSANAANAPPTSVLEFLLGFTGANTGANTNPPQEP